MNWKIENGRVKIENGRVKIENGRVNISSLYKHFRLCTNLMSSFDQFVWQSGQGCYVARQTALGVTLNKVIKKSNIFVFFHYLHRLLQYIKGRNNATLFEDYRVSVKDGPLHFLR